MVGVRCLIDRAPARGYECVVVAIDGIRPRKSGLHRNHRWGKRDSNPRSLSRGEGLKGRTSRHASQGKAVVSAAFGRASGEMAERADQRTSSREGVVPIIRNGVLEGACGVNGGTTQQDEDCARAGVARL